MNSSMSEEIAPFENDTRHRILETLKTWPIHHRMVGIQENPPANPDFVPLTDSILLALVQQAVEHDQERLGKQAEKLAAQGEVIRELESQLRKCREAGQIHALEKGIEQPAAVAA